MCVSSLLMSSCLQLYAKIYKHVITDDDHQLLQKGSNAFQVWSDTSGSDTSGQTVATSFKG